MSHWRRVRLAIEVMVLFVIAPVVIYYFVYVERIPLFQLLPYVMGGLIILLLLERDRSWVWTFVTVPRFVDVLKVLGTFAVCGGAMAYYAYVYFPDSFLRFPNVAYDLWLRVMIFYPLVSVTTQELFYRVFYFHRYAPLFGDRPYSAILFNGLLFAFMHAALFSYPSRTFHWEAIAISFAGGLLFAYRYHKTRAFWLVALEHALYGDLIFTVGLGRFFFTGVANV